MVGRIDSGNRLLARREPRAEWRSPRPQQHVPSVLVVLARQDGVSAGHREINGDFAPGFYDSGYLELIFKSVLNLDVLRLGKIRGGEKDSSEIYSSA